MRLTRGLIVVFVLVLAGCNPARTVTSEELTEAARHCKEPKVSVWYYMGSRKEYDYFRHEDLGQTAIYRIVTDDEIIDRRFPYTSNRGQWRPMPWGVASLRGLGDVPNVE